MVDVHCHVGMDLTDGEIIRIINGTNIDSSQEAVRLAEKNTNTWACVGIHPEEISKFKFTNIKILENLLKHPKVLGIGEIGLDYRQGISEEEKIKQKELFEIQLKLAEEYKLPVEIHNRNADNEIYESINKYKITGIMHCFTRNAEFMQKCAALGWYFSFGGFLLNKNNDRMQRVTREVSVDRLLLETDGPYNQVDVKIVARVIAELRHISVADVDRITSNNARQLFNRMV